MQKKEREVLWLLKKNPKKTAKMKVDFRELSLLKLLMLKRPKGFKV